MSSELRRGSLVASLLALRASVAIYIFHFALVPDTHEYSTGRAAWSSPITSLVGKIGGLHAVEIYSIIAVATLGFLLGYKGVRWSWIVALTLLPPGWYLQQPAADAAGTVASFVYGIYFYRSRRNEDRWFALAAVAAFHLEAALALGAGALLGRRRLLSVAGTLAAAGFVQILFGHWQVRYFLPGLAFAAATLGRGKPGVVELRTR